MIVPRAHGFIRAFFGVHRRANILFIYMDSDGAHFFAMFAKPIGFVAAAAVIRESPRTDRCRKY